MSKPGHMIARARLCPQCRGLNGAEARTCYRCQARLPTRAASALGDFVRSVLGETFPFTALLVFLCGAVFVFSTLDALELGARTLDVLFGAMPVSVAIRFGALGFGSVLHEPWRLLAAVFFHFGVLHLMFNLSALGHFGRALEGRIGGPRTACVFVLTGVLGFVVRSAWNIEVVSAGASGAIFGLSGALAGHLYGTRDRRWKDVLVQMLVMGLIVALALPNADNAAHIGGLGSGLVTGYVLALEKPRFRLTQLFKAVAILLMLLSVASIVLALRSPFWKAVREVERVGLGR